MTERERLKKLLAECINEPEKTCPMPEETTCDGCKYDMVHGACDILGRYADHLLANGVTFPPFKVGDTVYLIAGKKRLAYIVEREVISVIHCIESFDDRRETYHFCVAHEKSRAPENYNISDIGKRVFLTKEEATAAALAERSKE